MKQTALIEEHRRLGGRLIDFGGWELPVQYTGVMDEHLACRTAAGIFDVSHMGEITAEGPEAQAFLNFVVTNDVSKIAVGQAQYTAMCNPSGGILDDLIIYRRGQDRYFVVVNASNTEKDYAWIRQALDENSSRFPGVRLSNESTDWSQIALQGRRAQAILQTITNVPLSPLKNYWFSEGPALGGVPAIFARTGYTGEDGFEVYVPWADGPKVWRALLDAGRGQGLKPCGLGARDTLRLEMKYALYGHELTEETNPIEAGLGWVTKLDKGDFIGRDAIAKVKETGSSRLLVGLRMLDRGIPRQGYPIYSADGANRIGEVTSGTQSPSLGQAVAIAYVSRAASAVGTQVAVEIRGNRIAAEIVPTPFYKRPY